MKTLIRKLLIFCSFLLAIVIFADVANACSCIRSGTVDIEFAKSPTVVVLKLQSVEKWAEGEKGYGYDGVKQSMLSVEKVFKGKLKVGENLTFRQGGGGDCIWTFSEKEIGTEFLFYLGERSVKKNTWAGFTCSRSGSTKYRASDLLYLEKEAKMRDKTRLSGTISQHIPLLAESEISPYKMLTGKELRIIGNGKDITLKTDENGVYEIYDLPAGKYKVLTEGINGYKLYNTKDASTEVEIKAKSHTEQDFNFRIDNRISGRFFDANGKPLKDVCLDLLPASGKKPQYFYEADCTDENGKFEIDEIPIGTYVIVINDDGEISADEPFGTFYYPNVLSLDDAAKITIGAGDYFDNLIINAPKTAEIITVSGVLKFENGKTANDENAENASIEFIEESEDKNSKDKDDENISSRTQIDEKGRFTIRILKGQKGKLRGSLMTYEGKYENCPKLDKLIRKAGNRIGDIETPAIEIEAVSNLEGVELTFPFPSCKKKKIE